MALLGNYSLLRKSPAYFMSGVGADDRSNWTNNGQMRSMGLYVGADAATRAEWRGVSLPHGQAAGGAWHLAQTAGFRHARANISFSAAGTGALGRNIVGASSLSISSAGTGGLIAGAVGTATMHIAAAGAAVGTVAAQGTATMTFSGAANVGAKGWLVGGATMTFNGTLVAYAKGFMVGTTADTTTLTPAIIAEAVAAHPKTLTVPKYLGLK
jgi:hypothetical protein